MQTVTDPIRLGAVLGVLFALLLSATAVNAAAALDCDLESMAATYRAARDAEKGGDHAAARATWRHQAERGYPPAQVRLARSLITEDKGNEALLWALAAAQGGDRDGANLARDLLADLDTAERDGVRRRLWDRAAAFGDCLGNWPGAVKIASGGALWVGDLSVSLPSRTDARETRRIGKRLAEALAKVREILPVAALHLRETGGIEITPTKMRHQYVGWKRNGVGGLRITAGVLDDPDFDHLARAIAFAAARDAARHLPDFHLLDPYVRPVDDKVLLGSVYADVDNTPFFERMIRVLALAKDLPPDLRRYVEAVDAVHYAPDSRFTAKGAGIDTVAAFYDTRLSEPGNRMVFIRRDMKWTSDTDLLLILVHEGTHAVQHATVGAYRDSHIPEQQAALRRFPAGSPERKAVGDDLRRMSRYVRNWAGHGWTEDGMSPRLRFECEASLNEVHAAQAIGATPETVEDSQYIKLCDDARRQVVAWREGR